MGIHFPSLLVLDLCSVRLTPAWMVIGAGAGRWQLRRLRLRQHGQDQPQSAHLTLSSCGIFPLVSERHRRAVCLYVPCHIFVSRLRLHRGERKQELVRLTCGVIYTLGCGKMRCNTYPSGGGTQRAEGRVKKGRTGLLLLLSVPSPNSRCAWCRRYLNTNTYLALLSILFFFRFWLIYGVFFPSRG